MLYPLSPFKSTFNPHMLFTLDNYDYDTNTQIQIEYLENLLKWLCTAPKLTSYRVNNLLFSTDEVYQVIEHQLQERKLNAVVEKHCSLDEVIVIHHQSPIDLSLTDINKEVVIDTNCAAAVLRGANIYAPGIMGMMTGTRCGDKVKICADIGGRCKKGYQKLFDDPEKIVVGIGTVKMVRSQLFGENILPSGVAVEVAENLSGCPVLGSDFLPRGSALLQNLPSVICVRTLNPCAGDTVLDMCAAPGNKTTHIAALMKNTGLLIAIDKTPSKIKCLKQTCDEYKANVHIFQADSTKIVGTQETDGNLQTGPPFSLESFDKILLDAPCSALGKRPQLCNNISEKVLKSYVPLQRKLFQSAVQLLKPNGRLVYSTCTITVSENEGIVAWALKTFNNLKLVKSEVSFGECGLKNSGLSDEQRQLIQRYGPHAQVDSVGFFIACFIKQCIQ